ncbi:hypothetical protein KC366_g6649 [Hortaea werneckii]|uniref:Xyloglucan-specific endo-beta-1,4-glucanase A n=1 Tax=Hortaea werneckii EXF-2000 TaxID=1157616 RepID=A0A1Z5TR07_HORWE|nr:hypothetical protein KC358_g4989 [Hortaea werneckii]OTA38428.1 hypothetical protein BTJ68_01718 [Hortaea werneckii EXF-2000]KAI6938602.1 hypothetical protein KC341_g4793 [Hortaea werneckii]KAI6939807.1 hypothetical protein KC348_g5195 [Hortaea werneckii]KAI6974362.1 hypothetical protein KC321_g5158 [Hortaea werneckii]
MKASTALASGSLLALSAAAPTRTENKRSATSDCSQYGETTVGNYIVYNDLWGQDNGSGSQCVTVTGVTDDSLEWSTTWSWSDNKNDVKSYSNAVVDTDSVQLSSIKSMQSSWDWKYTGGSLTADVAYDMFTSSSADGSEEFEVMVWLANLNAGPISSSYSASGGAETIATLNVAGYDWSLYKGSNGAQTVYSFLPSDSINSFSGDVYDFFTYLINDQGFDGSQYLVSAGAGTEAFVGQNAEFTVLAYSLEIESGSGSSSNAITSSSSSAVPSSAPVATSSAAVIAGSSSAPATKSSTSASYAASSIPVATSLTTAPSSSIASPSTTAQQTQIASSSVPITQPTSSSSPETDSNCHVKYVYV